MLWMLALAQMLHLPQRSRPGASAELPTSRLTALPMLDPRFQSSPARAIAIGVASTAHSEICPDADPLCIRSPCAGTSHHEVCLAEGVGSPPGLGECILKGTQRRLGNVPAIKHGPSITRGMHAVNVYIVS